MAQKNLLFDYLSGRLTMEQLREHVAESKDTSHGEWLELAEFDRKCRRILSRVAPRPGAADRLKGVVSGGGFEDGSLCDSLPTANLWMDGARSGDLDVVGAQKIRNKKKQGRGKGKSRT